MYFPQVTTWQTAAQCRKFLGTCQLVSSPFLFFLQLIPYSFIEKEASHVAGFSPELALVTIGGGKELEERLVVRFATACERGYLHR